MGLVINLRTERKRAKRRQAEQEAAAQRLRNGRPKSARKFDTAQSEQADRRLDQHRILSETESRQ